MACEANRNSAILIVANPMSSTRVFSAIAAGSATAALLFNSLSCQPTTRERIQETEIRLAALEKQLGLEADGVGAIAGLGTNPDANRQIYDDWSTGYEAEVRKW